MKEGKIDLEAGKNLQIYYFTVDVKSEDIKKRLENDKADINVINNLKI